MGEKFKIIEFVMQIVFVVLLKFWKLCILVGLIFFLIFWYYGGVLILVFFLIGGFGMYEFFNLLQVIDKFQLSGYIGEV